MPADSLELSVRATKSIKKLPEHIRKKIFASIKLIEQNPIAGIKLKGELDFLYKFRVGDYRIIYLFDQKKSHVSVVAIEHRQGVYK